MNQIGHYARHLNKKVSRADFFRWGRDGIKKMGREMVTTRIEQLKERYGLNEWYRLANRSDIGARPQLFLARGNPLLVSEVSEKEVVAFSATCPEEGGLLEWRERPGCYHCPFCRSNFDTEGKSLEHSGVNLKRHDSRVCDEQVFIMLEGS